MDFIVRAFIAEFYRIGYDFGQGVTTLPEFIRQLNTTMKNWI